MVIANNQIVKQMETLRAIIETAQDALEEGNHNNVFIALKTAEFETWKIQVPTTVSDTPKRKRRTAAEIAAEEGKGA